MHDLDFETDKLDAIYQVRLPSMTKSMVDRLTAPWKKKLNAEILKTVSRVLHEANFRPSLYLKSNGSNEYNVDLCNGDAEAVKIARLIRQLLKESEGQE
ncbi:MAG: hypothetical protein HPY67_03850 [Syntrophaceae bacterium]|nr:hypothetical protein [Syntrophaceae bacterium]